MFVNINWCFGHVYTSPPIFVYTPQFQIPRNNPGRRRKIGVGLGAVEPVHSLAAWWGKGGVKRTVQTNELLLRAMGIDQISMARICDAVVQRSVGLEQEREHPKQ